MNDIHLNPLEERRFAIRVAQEIVDDFLARHAGVEKLKPLLFTGVLHEINAEVCDLISKVERPLNKKSIDSLLDIAESLDAGLFENDDVEYVEAMLKLMKRGGYLLRSIT